MADDRPESPEDIAEELVFYLDMMTKLRISTIARIAHSHERPLVYPREPFPFARRRLNSNVQPNLEELLDRSGSKNPALSFPPPDERGKPIRGTTFDSIPNSAEKKEETVEEALAHLELEAMLRNNISKIYEKLDEIPIGVNPPSDEPGPSRNPSPPDPAEDEEYERKQKILRNMR